MLWGRFVYVMMLSLLCTALACGAVLAQWEDTDLCEVTYQDLPTSMVWDGTYYGGVGVRNTGTYTWGDWFEGDIHLLVEVDGGGGFPFRIYRWGIGTCSLQFPVGPGESYSWGGNLFEIRAPAWTTLKYTPPVTSTSPGTTDHFDCNFMMFRLAPWPPFLLTSDAAVSNCVVSRFPDEGGAWNFYIEELAGRVPLIVTGFGDGTYRPTATVKRDSMAVYMARTLKLDLLLYEGLFADVAEGSFGALEIEALVRTGIVTGYADGYRPSLVVNRGQMAAYVSRGIAGGDEFVPSGPAEPTFPDVGTDHGFYKHVEYALDQGVVTGFGDGTYRPATAVNRGQMSAYIWRGFIMPTGVPVVLGGPTVTWPSPPTEGSGFYYGWPTYHNAFASDVPGFAYVVFDAVRLNNGLAFGGTWDVTFDLVGPESAQKTFSMTPEEISGAREAAMASGDPYLILLWDVPSGLAVGEYTLTTSVEDETGAMHELGRQQTYTIIW